MKLYMYPVPSFNWLRTEPYKRHFTYVHILLNKQLVIEGISVCLVFSNLFTRIQKVPQTNRWTSHWCWKWLIYCREQTHEISSVLKNASHLIFLARACISRRVGDKKTRKGITEEPSLQRTWTLSVFCTFIFVSGIFSLSWSCGWECLFIHGRTANSPVWNQL